MTRIRIQGAALAALLLAGAMAAAGGASACDFVVTNHPVPSDAPGSAPEVPRQEQIDDFGRRLQAYASWHGSSLAVGDSHTTQVPVSLLREMFGVSGAGTTANFGMSGATVEEVWWMVDRLTTGFDWTDADGVDHGHVQGVDLSNVTQVLLMDFGGNSIYLTPSCGADIADQIYRVIGDIRDRTHKTASGVSDATVLATRKLEGPNDGSTYRSKIGELNRTLKVLPPGSPYTYSWRNTPNDFYFVGTDGMSHVGTDHDDPYLFPNNNIHYGPNYVSEYICPVVRGFFAPGGGACSGYVPPAP